MDLEEEKFDGESEEESSEEEEYTDSEEEMGPRLKPMFVRKYVIMDGWVVGVQKWELDSSLWLLESML